MRSIVDRIINYYLSESLKRSNSVDVFVTELVACPMKYELRLRYPSLLIQLNFNEKILIGKLLHHGIEAILRDLMLISGDNIRTEVPVSGEINGLRIVGRADIVLDNEVIEIKTTSSVNNLPRDSHVLQTAIYAKLLNKARGRLVYFILNNDKRIIEFDVDPINDDDLTNLIEEFKKRKPTPRYPWECNYCVFKQFCPKRGDHP